MSYNCNLGVYDNENPIQLDWNLILSNSSRTTLEFIENANPVQLDWNRILSNSPQTVLEYINAIQEPQNVLKNPIDIDVPATSDQDQCCVCLNSKKIMVFKGCGHLCVCNSCSNNLSTCPICRRKSSTMRIFY
jgi:hypothetical protein